MIGAVVYKLCVRENGYLPKHQGRLLHAAFFHILSCFSEELAACTHDDVRIKSFTVSDLDEEQKNKYNVDRIFVRKGQTFFWRVTALTDELLEAALSVPIGFVIKIGAVQFSVLHIISNGNEKADSGLLDINALIHTCLMENEISSITFRFLSPVSFRTFKYDYPFPLPQLIYGSLVDKWNLAGMPIFLNKDEVRSIAEKLIPIAWQGKTEQIYFKSDRGITGFTGNFSFSVAMEPLDYRRIFLLLAQFSVFAGVGRLTGQGMGQTRITYR
ncbi:MAG: CRISPR-associated endoribonuclease Cas6 [Acidaminococcaceae bacterium]|jgi:CRISPR-associated endoribonuclease Cas6|nr:CRISPR-associated endoribonuclease Cas6 [Acidaminococcaceae bacterium]